MNEVYGVASLVLCGPGDVAKEIGLVAETIEEWNTHHGDGRRHFVKHHHWLTDCAPDMADRPQGIINRDIIDKADVLVAVFWSRFGSPTGVADSGTEEEIRRAMRFGKRVMLYFSDLEPLPATADQSQLEKHGAFRAEMMETGLCWQFQSRRKFKVTFRGHFAKVMNETLTKTMGNQHVEGATNQSMTGSKNNIQVGGDVGSVDQYQNPPKVENIVEREPGCITSEEQLIVRRYIEELVENTTGMSRQEAFGEWWGRFQNEFKAAKYALLKSDQMPDVQHWKRIELGKLRRKSKRKLPEDYRKSRIRAII